MNLEKLNNLFDCRKEERKEFNFACQFCENEKYCNCIDNNYSLSKKELIIILQKED